MAHRRQLTFSPCRLSGSCRRSSTSWRQPWPCAARHAAAAPRPERADGEIWRRKVARACKREQELTRDGYLFLHGNKRRKRCKSDQLTIEECLWVQLHAQVGDLLVRLPQLLGFASASVATLKKVPASSSAPIPAASSSASVAASTSSCEIAYLEKGRSPSNFSPEAIGQPTCC